MGTIHLKGMEFFAYHGLHAAEQSIGNRYRVDVALNTDFGRAAERDEISGTVDYAKVFNIVQARMQRPARLLEHLAYEITQTLRQTFPQLQGINVEVSKFNPPLGGTCEAASVEYTWYEGMEENG